MLLSFPVLSAIVTAAHADRRAVEARRRRWPDSAEVVEGLRRALPDHVPPEVDDARSPAAITLARFSAAVNAMYSRAASMRLHNAAAFCRDVVALVTQQRAAPPAARELDTPQILAALRGLGHACPPVPDDLRGISEAASWFVSVVNALWNAAELAACQAAGEPIHISLWCESPEPLFYCGEAGDTLPRAIYVGESSDDEHLATCKGCLGALASYRASFADRSAPEAAG